MLRITLRFTCHACTSDYMFSSRITGRACGLFQVRCIDYQARGNLGQSFGHYVRHDEMVNVLMLFF